MSGYDIYEGTDPEFARRIQQLIASSGGRVSIISAYRSVERQQQLFDEAVRRDGSEQAARRWVAPPGRSNHNRGVAMDLRFHTSDAREWAHENAGRFGLNFPMSHEPWHIEPVGVRDGTYSSNIKFDPDAYTIPPAGVPDVVDTPRTLQSHMFSLHEMLLNPSRFIDNDDEHEGDIGTAVPRPDGKMMVGLGLKRKQLMGEDEKSLLGYNFADLTGTEQPNV